MPPLKQLRTEQNFAFVTVHRWTSHKNTVMVNIDGMLMGNESLRETAAFFIVEAERLEQLPKEI